MRKSFIIVGIVIVTLMASLVAYAVTWPTTFTKHADIMMDANPYEPSGLAWNSVTNKMFTVCNTGQVTMMNMDGTEQVNVKAPAYADYEAVAIADANSSKVYIGIENPDSILEYDWNVGFNASMKSWNLTSVMDGADNSGLEGLTFVPNGYHPFDNSVSGGLFYAAIQRTPVLNDAVTYNDYLIYAFDIDLSTSGKIVKWWGIPVAAGTPNGDISDMYFNKDTGLLYVLYDGANRLIEMKTDGTVIKDYSNVPVNAQEGLVIKTSYPSLTADVYIGSDSDRSISWYSGYPVNFDADKDGVTADLDCNDNDASISALKTYYQDLDKDGLGSDVVVSVCSLSVPAGYVLNSDDTDDNFAGNPNDKDGDGVVASLDCNDNDASISALKTYYQDLDKDGLGSDVSTSICSNVAPAGYVTNSDDTNDNYVVNSNDKDGDGVVASLDCNDNNPLYWYKQLYFIDQDGDGYGSWKKIKYICVPPSGYVNNAKDKNDKNASIH